MYPDKATGRKIVAVFFLIAVALIPFEIRAEDRQAEIAAHYMPWFASKPVSGRWGWHWTMDHFDPDIIEWQGKREAATRDYPLIGLYDSGDLDAIECHVQLMKLAGIDGVIIDWYGTKDFNDYAMIHQNTEKLISVVKRAGMKFAICYEDQSVGHMVKGGVIEEENAVSHQKRLFDWIEETWFADEAYWQVNGNPLLLIFGPQYFEPEQWQECLASFEKEPATYVLPHLGEKYQNTGIIGWPPVADGKTVLKSEWMEVIADWYERQDCIGIAFPGFHDIYEQAGVGPGYGRIPSDYGATMEASLKQAFEHNFPLVQIATWNDHGEGTGIEPTESNGYRFLETIQQSAKVKGASSGDLRLPVWLYQLRKRFASDQTLTEKMDRAGEALLISELGKARSLILELKESEKSASARFREDYAGEDSKYRLLTGIPYREEGDPYMKDRCRLDLYYPADGKPFSTVVWFHGGGITNGFRNVPIPLRNKGVAVLAANYRLNPRVEAPAYIEDAAAAVAWACKNIESFGGSKDRIYLSGHSAGGYLASMVGMDKKWLEPHGVNTDDIGGLIPFSGHTITHFTVRKERGQGRFLPVVDELAPLFHVRKDAPPILLITGGRETELMGRYEENAYFWRMLKETGHPNATLIELEGFDHGGMPEPAFPLLLEFVEKNSEP